MTRELTIFEAAVQRIQARADASPYPWSRDYFDPGEIACWEAIYRGRDRNWQVVMMINLKTNPVGSDNIYWEVLGFAGQPDDEWDFFQEYPTSTGDPGNAVAIAERVLQAIEQAC